MANSWLIFGEKPNPKRKTKRWVVLSKSSNILLGKVSWHAPWRKYTFFPEPETIWSPDCLDDVSEFCLMQTEFRKQERSRLQ